MILDIVAWCILIGVVNLWFCAIFGFNRDKLIMGYGFFLILAAVMWAGWRVFP